MVEEKKDKSSLCGKLISDKERVFLGSLKICP
jgi:hypothetical protein